MADANRSPLLNGHSSLCGFELRAADAPSAIHDDEPSIAELRHLAAHLQEVREQERREIAREIHDELGHQLTALKIDLVAMERELQRASSRLSSRAASMKTTLDQLIGNVRRLSSDLRPGILDDFGLVAAIEWQMEVFEENTGIAVELAVDADDSDLPAPLATAMFRILQECLANVARQAHAERVRIALDRGAQSLRLDVRGAGGGVSRPALQGDAARGVTAMRERVRALGGVFRIEDGPDELAVCAVLPLEPAGERFRPALSRALGALPAAQHDPVDLMPLRAAS